MPCHAKHLRELVSKYGDARAARALHNSDENTARIDLTLSAIDDFFSAAVASVRAEVAAEVLAMDDGYGWESDMIQRIAKMICEQAPQ